jgi:hypothetical protein
VGPAYTTQLSSSFDRTSASVSPAEPGWFANKDFAQPTRGEPVVLLDAAGPGVVTRIWSANPSGTVRIYLDGAAMPALDAPLDALLDGRVQPFAAPYALTAANGHDLYFPIPFSRHCRILVQTNENRFYYQVDYRRYPDGTKLESFSEASLAAAECQKSRTAARLELAAKAALPQLAAAESFKLAIEPGKRSERRLIAAEGGSVIRELRIRLSSLETAALRGTLFTFEFDGEQTVQVPLGDFFGTGPGLAPVRSLPHRWDEDTLLFGAQWHAPSAQTSTPANDWALLAVRGAGKYVGTLLNVQNGDLQWWGEGDERIFVDDERFPSHFGTGTEDYFGYGWCSNERFTLPFIGQTQSSGRQNWGATSLYRFHVLDAIPFRTGVRFDLEVRHWRKQPVPLVYDAIGFFYVRPGATVEPRADDPTQYQVPVTTNPPLELSPARYTCGGN